MQEPQDMQAIVQYATREAIQQIRQTAESGGISYDPSAPDGPALIEDDTRYNARNALRTNPYRVQVEGSVMRSDGCSSGCPCFCHQYHKQLVLDNSFIGRLFVGYSALSRMFWKCNTPLCTARSSKHSVNVEYMFPRWLLWKQIRLNTSWGYTCDPAASLRIRNVLRTDDRWFRAAVSGDLHTVKEMIIECPSRINDVDVRGFSAAYVSLHAESCNSAALGLS